ncbi:hypothetical protein KCG44_02485 [Pacificimonas sp. WHA3]|uniref:Uncharacterized protein n=1 Tax=Pacificimonas pallii TaxID=2827236 RepID=A0ABS6SBB0_9SPHN|nr:COBRA family GPI-anchored protein [Pacificimonas pallii]MBV7255649.1 hypothetical protein [Pacificimonas pallii]
MMQDDLNALRRIAEEGRDLPLMGGRHFLIWGIALPVAGIYHWAVVSGHIDAPGWTLTLSWFGLAGFATIIGRMIGARRGQGHATETSASRVERGVWAAAGATFAILAIGLLLHASLGPQSGAAGRFAFFVMLAPMTFGIYAIAINASAVATNALWMRPYVALSFAFAAVTILMLSSPWLYLVYAIGIAAISIPLGVALVRREGASRG